MNNLTLGNCYSRSALTKVKEQGVTSVGVLQRHVRPVRTKVNKPVLAYVSNALCVYKYRPGNDRCDLFELT